MFGGAVAGAVLVLHADVVAALLVALGLLLAVGMATKLFARQPGPPG